MCFSRVSWFTEGMSDIIHIKRLKISTHIGVPNEERAEKQDLCVSVDMVPATNFSDLSDEIDDTVDYYQVSLRVKELAAGGARKLIETFASDISMMVLAEFNVLEVKVNIEKYILPDADYVGVTMVRHRDL